MRCTNCGTENYEQSPFCKNCGAVLPVPQAGGQFPPAAAPVQPAYQARQQMPPPAPQAGATACHACGAVNPPGAQACLHCGAPLAQYAAGSPQGFIMTGQPTPPYGQPPAAQKKKFPVKLVAVIGGGALAVALAAVLLVVLLGRFAGTSGRYTMQSTTVRFVYSEDTEKTAIVINGRAADFTIGDNVRGTARNFAGDICLALTYEDDLYYVTENSADRIAGDVDLFALSADGTAAAFTDYDGALYLYGAAGGGKEKIADGLENPSIALSPGGNALAYTMDDYDCELYLYTDGEAARIGKNLMCLSVADSGAAYAWGTDNDTLYYCSADGDKNKIASGVTTPELRTNRDNTEALFVSDGKAYLCVNGGEKVKVGNGDYVSPCIPLYLAYQANALLYSYAYTIAFGIDTFAGSPLLLADSGLVYLDKQLETTKIAGDVDGCYMAADGDTVFYERNANLYRVSMKSPDSPEQLAKDVQPYEFTFSADGKRVYYISEDDELWCISGKDDAVRIADDVYTVVTAPSGAALFIADYSDTSKSGTLYTCVNGKDKTRVADDVAMVSTACAAAYYAVYTDSDYTLHDLYASPDGSEFSLAAQDVGGYLFY